jgi:hypothetical protein
VDLPNPETGMAIDKALRHGPLFVDPLLPLRQRLVDQRQHLQVGLGRSAPEVARDGIRVFLDARQGRAGFSLRLAVGLAVIVGQQFAQGCQATMPGQAWHQGCDRAAGYGLVRVSDTD